MHNTIKSENSKLSHYTSGTTYIWSTGLQTSQFTLHLCYLSNPNPKHSHSSSLLLCPSLISWPLLLVFSGPLQHLPNTSPPPHTLFLFSFFSCLLNTPVSFTHHKIWVGDKLQCLFSRWESWDSRAAPWPLWICPAWVPVGALTFWKQNYLLFLGISSPYLGLMYLEGAGITTSSPGKSQLACTFMEHFSGTSSTVLCMLVWWKDNHLWDLSFHSLSLLLVV